MQKRAQPRYFDFTRKERNGTLFLLFIIILVIIFPLVYSFIQSDKIVTIDEESAIMDSLHALQTISNKPNAEYPAAKKSNQKYLPVIYEQEDNEKLDLFYFDPNTLPAEGWKKLGVKENTINTIQHYLSKNGRFREPGDIRKIWGINEKLADRLVPYVSIKDNNGENKSRLNNIDKNVTLKRPSYKQVDINLSDSVAWMELPGIGARLSGRIIHFRERLGGFYKIDQVGETFGLPDSVFQKIRPMLVLDKIELRQININTAGFEELKQHPYIRYQLATQIIQYRKQHGEFSQNSDLKKIMTVSDSLFLKLDSYIMVK